MIFFTLFLILSGIYDGLMYPHLPASLIYYKKIHLTHAAAFLMRAVVAIGIFGISLNLIAAALITPFIITESLVITGNIRYGFKRDFLGHHPGWDGNPYVRIIMLLAGTAIFMI